MNPGSSRTLVAVIVLSFAAVARAQSPQAQPRVQAGNVVYLGKFAVPSSDGAGGSLAYGGVGLGLGPDGKSLYFGCHDGSGAMARVSIPSIGGTASVVEPCRAVPNLQGINATDVNGIKIGGTLSWNGRLIVSAYTFYDASGSTVYSHFAGAGNVSTLTGPYRVGTDPAATVGGYMGVIPSEWRTLFGGPALTGKCCTSIISRSSYGPSASVFDPAHVGTQAAIPSTMLVGYPEAHQTLGRWDAVSTYYTGTMRMGGLAFPAGTRSLLFVARRGETFCYGTGAECKDPSNADKGNHGYPYRHVVMAYDANDLLAVKLGTKKPWDVTPYTQWTLPEMSNDGTADISSAVYDHATRRWYITLGLTGGAQHVHVYEINNAVLQSPPSPSPEVCGDGVDNDQDGLIDEGCAVVPPPAEVCGDGIDNDKDGLVDEGCAVVPPPAEVCGDGIDNDKDGIVDEGCVEATPEKCGDLIDNDQDGLVDEGCAPVVVEVCNDAKDNDGDGLVDEGCATSAAAPGTVRRLYSSVSRSTVSFKWSPPITGGAVTDYVLEAGAAPGTTFYSAPVSTTSLRVPNVGNGRYYVRVKARNANGTGKASNEVTVSVGCYTRPRQVSGLRATSSGGVVTLTWTDPDGCSGTSYDISVADSITTSTRLMSTDAAEATTLLSAGSYTARVQTRSESGVSEPTTLQFTVDDNVCPAPRLHLGLRKVVAGRRIGLFWSPLDPDVAADDDSVALVSYAIEAGSAPGTTDIGVVPMGRASQFITDVPPGTYYVRIRAGNACGGGLASNEVKLVVR